MLNIPDFDFVNFFIVNLGLIINLNYGSSVLHMHHIRQKGIMTGPLKAVHFHGGF